MFSAESQDQPVVIATIGTTSQGTGSGDVHLETQPGIPNVTVKVITPLIAILVRFGHTFLDTFIATLGVAETGVLSSLIQAPDFPAKVKAAAIIAFGAAALGLAKNVLTIFKGWEGKYPLATGSI